MHWHYYLPGGWEDPAQGSKAADVWLLSPPENDAVASLQVSVLAIAPTKNSPGARILLRPPDPGDYRINESVISVRVDTLSRDEVLAWTRVWLEHAGHGPAALVEGTWAEFSGTSAEAILVDAIGYLVVSLERVRALRGVPPAP